MHKEEKISRVVEDSLQYFKNGLYCSEAILKAFNDNYNLGLTAEVLKIATAFGVGLGASKCCCGSLTGGTMVLSLLFGRSSAHIPETEAFDAASRFHDEFKKEFGAACCRVLTKPIQWGTPEHHKYCEQFVGKAAELTAKMIAEKVDGK
ncbi:MAG: C-GCAxxG-C-C family protein [Clostridia bacterium]|nr:C-GCAxxG-C-C family protein [Clostridia bacterium]